MSKCRKCRHQNEVEICEGCYDNDAYEGFTNADRIRAMNDEIMSKELIPLLMEICEDGVPSEEWFLEWLKLEVKE